MACAAFCTRPPDPPLRLQNRNAVQKFCRSATAKRSLRRMYSESGQLELVSISCLLGGSNASDSVNVTHSRLRRIYVCDCDWTTGRLPPKKGLKNQTKVNGFGVSKWTQQRRESQEPSRPSTLIQKCHRPKIGSK